MLGVHCAICHGVDGSGGRGPDLRKPTYEQANTDAALIGFMRNGGGGMPGDWFLADDELRTLGEFVPRDEQGNVPKWVLAERSRLRREIDPADLLAFLKLAGQPSRPDMRNLVHPKVAFDAAKTQYEPLHLGHDYGLFGLLA